MKILAIIPARGGSKGVPRKNIIDICGKPLIAYSIEPALQAKKRGIIDEIIVSTDDQEIADISKELGASVPFFRPEELSNDKAKSVDLMIHAYCFFEEREKTYDTIMLLQPTSPLRTRNDIESSISLYQKLGATSLISCYKESIHETGLYHKDGEWAKPLSLAHNEGLRRQDISDLYVRNGAIFIVDVEYMLSEKKVFDDRPAMYVMPKERSINIDTMSDIEQVRMNIMRVGSQL